MMIVKHLFRNENKLYGNLMLVRVRTQDQQMTNTYQIDSQKDQKTL